MMIVDHRTQNFSCKLGIDGSYVRRQNAKMVENVTFTYLDPRGNAVMFRTGWIKMRRGHNDRGRRIFGR